MCTVTVITTCEPSSGAWRDPPRGIEFDAPAAVRLMCNRDESRLRAIATAPVLRRCGDRMALMPIDPASGGTWIGTNDAGLVATLLNANPTEAEPQRPTVRRSRGIIVPRLLEAEALDGAVQSAARLEPGDFAPFRVVVMSRGELADVRSSGAGLTISRTPLDAHAWLFTSSGLGDAVVEPPRRDLFERTLAQLPDRSTQTAFHATHWPDRSHLSVWMERADARTVSTTVIELLANDARMLYAPADAGGTATEQRIALQRERTVSGARQ